MGVVSIVPVWCFVLVGGRGCGYLRWSLWSHGDRWGTAAVLLIRVSWGSGPWPVTF